PESTGPAGGACAAGPANGWSLHADTWDNGGSCRSDSGTPGLRPLGTERHAPQGPPYGTVRWPAWRPGDWVAYGRRTWCERPGHSVGRSPPVRAWQSSHGP